jgi:hypothetical protein
MASATLALGQGIVDGNTACGNRLGVHRSATDSQQKNEARKSIV